MRTPALQYLYLQKPVTMIIIICIISVFPWLGMDNLSAPGESQEAIVATAMLESGNWVLPQLPSGEWASHPPLAHWLMALFSLPQGYVSELTSRLPASLAFITLIGFTLVFFGKRLRFQQAFIAVLLLITSLGMHRAAILPREGMLLTTLMVIGMCQLHRWEDVLELKGLPIGIPILLGCAILTGEVIGILMPLFVFGVYLLMLHKYAYRTIFKTLLYAGISSLFLPALWYIAAWKQGGDAFLHMIWAKESINNGIVFNIIALAFGFMPWTLFFFFSLFGLKYSQSEKPLKERIADTWKGMQTMDKEKLFSLVALTCIFLFYSFFPFFLNSEWALLPAYPFIAIFLAQYALYITEYRTKVTRVFAILMATGATCAAIGIGLAMSGDLVEIASRYEGHWRIMYLSESLSSLFAQPNGKTICFFVLLLMALATTYYQLFKKINIKILYATIALVFVLHFLFDGLFM